MIYFILLIVGIFVGIALGLLIAGLCVAAKKSDDAAIFQSYYHQQEKQKVYTK